MSKKIVFPKDFLWGGAMSAEQTEGSSLGVKGETIFDRWYKENPEDFFDQIGPNRTIELIKNYKDDIKLWKSIGMNSIRTSFSWSRLFPDGNYENPCKESVAWYHDFIDELIKNDIKPMFTLFHFDMPIIYQNIGGWENRKVWDYFLKYSSFVLKEYGDKIDYWTTMNEPWVPIQSAYFNDVQYPKVNNVQRGINAAYGILMAHAKVVNHFNKTMSENKKIGAIFNSTIVYPRDNKNPEDVKAAEHMNLYQFTGLTDPMIKGKFNKDLTNILKKEGMLPENHLKEDIDEIAQIKIDWIGLNYYAPARAKSPTNPESENILKKYFEAYDWPEKRENKFRGWEIYPEAIYDNFQFLINRYGSEKEYMLTEYGMGVENENIFRDNKGIIHDQYRISFMKEHLLHLNRVMQENPHVKFLGAHMWASIDCWSWGNAFKNRYGLIEVDLKTQKRTIKQSGYFSKELSETNSFSSDFKKMEEYINFDDLEFSESVKID